jgi:hypothetical protein
MPAQTVVDGTLTPETERAQLNTLDWLGGRA